MSTTTTTKGNIMTTTYNTASEYAHRGYTYTTDINLVDYTDLICAEAEAFGIDPMQMNQIFAHAVRNLEVEMIHRKGNLGPGFRPDEATKIVEQVKIRCKFLLSRADGRALLGL
jgi:hypothetical protein